MIQALRRFAAVVRNFLIFLLRRFDAPVLRRFAVVPKTSKKSMCGGLRRRGVSAPHTPYALRGAYWRAPRAYDRRGEGRRLNCRHHATGPEKGRTMTPQPRRRLNRCRAETTEPTVNVMPGAVGAGAATAWGHRDMLWEHPIATVLSALSAYGAAKGLAAPGFVRWLYECRRHCSRLATSQTGIKRSIGAVNMMARSNPDVAAPAAHLRDAFTP
jgi:hypothetical protein